MYKNLKKVTLWYKWYIKCFTGEARSPDGLGESPGHCVVNVQQLQAPYKDKNITARSSEHPLWTARTTVELVPAAQWALHTELQLTGGKTVTIS